MKQFFIKAVHFSGSALFAAMLLFLMALLVAFGTFLESKTGSHQFAMEAVYTGILFRLLLGGFFINILVSALRRYPFKLKHVPFLITHLGLLIIITGLIIKSFFGLQGIVVAPAGLERSIVFVPEEKQLVIELKDGQRFEHALTKDFFGGWNLAKKSEPYFDQGERASSPVDVRLLGYSPHSKLIVDSFFKGGLVDIAGLRPLPSFSWKKEDELPLSGKIRMHQEENGLVNFIAVKTATPEEAVKALMQQAILSVYVYGNKDPVMQRHLKENDLEIVALDKVVLKDFPIESINALNKTGLRKTALKITPTLLFIQDKDQEVHIVGVDANACIQAVSLGERGEGGQLISYDGGFSGYGVQVPFPCTLHKEKDDVVKAAENLKHMEGQIPLMPFAESAKARELLALFLKTLSDTGSFTYDCSIPLSEEIEEALTRTAFFNDHKELVKGLALISMLVDDALFEDESSTSLSEAFLKKDYPFLRRFAELYEKNDAVFLAALLDLMLDLSLELPFNHDMTVLQKAKLLSLIARIYSLSFEDLAMEKNASPDVRPLLETKLSLQWKKDRGEGVKSEELAPLFLFEIAYQDKKERVVAGFDLEGNGFTSSCFGEEGKVYLSPLTYQIPYLVRVQDAREIVYPGTTQAAGYECTFYLKDRRTEEIALHQIGLNRVFETKDGYRFFLSNIHPSDESAPQEVRLALNYDPSRRLFIFAGSILVAIGILLLYFFVMRKR